MGDNQLSEDEKVAIIARQTDITRADILVLLEEHQGDHLAVIRSYISGGQKRSETKQSFSLNQQIYSNIRSYLDSHTKELQN